MKKAVVVFLLAFSYCQVAVAQYDPNCTRINYGTSCRLRSTPYVTKVFDEQFELLIGVENSLEIFELDLNYSDSIDLTSNDFYQTRCRINFGYPRSACQNFIRNIKLYDEDEIIVCGTNAYHPSCTLHKLDSLTNYTLLSNETHGTFSLAAFNANNELATFVASNGYLYAFTVFSRNSLDTIFGLVDGYSQGNFTFVAGVPINDNFLFQHAAPLLIHEHGDYIFVYFTERALEITGATLRYTRIVRLCKTDRGISYGRNVRQNRFLTFDKARLICAVGQLSVDVLSDAVEVITPNGDTLVYGVFNLPMNGPSGSAICRISYDPSVSGSVTNLFNSIRGQGHYVQVAADAWVREIKPIFESYACPSMPGPQRSVDNSLRYVLRVDTVASTLILFSFTQFLDKIAAEVLEYQEVMQEIIFYTTLQGSIMQLVHSDGQNDEVMLYQATGDDPVRQLVLHKVEGTRNLVATTTSNRVLQIVRGRCYCFTDCFSCLEFRDPYCGWDSRRGACVSKLVYNDTDLTEAFSSNILVIFRVCGVREEEDVPVDFPCPLLPPETFFSILTTTPEQTTGPPTTTQPTNTTDETANTTTTTIDTPDSDNETTDVTDAPATAENVFVYILNMERYSSNFIAIASGYITALLLITVGLIIPYLNYKIRQKWRVRYEADTSKSSSSSEASAN